MRTSPAHPARPLAVAVVGGMLSLALFACTGIGADQRVTPKAAPVYPQLATYPDIPVIEDQAYGRADGKPLLLDVCLPVDSDSTTPPRAAIVSIHGGSWARGDKANVNWRSVCQWLASEGFVAASVNYRLAPGSTFPAQIEDVDAAVRWLRSPEQVARFNLDPALIGAFGGSAGGNLAALLGTEGTGPLDAGNRVAAVAELSGPVDLSENGRNLGTLTTLFERVQLRYLGCRTLAKCPSAILASPLYDIDSSDPPFFVGSSTTELIPIEQSEALVKRLRDVGIDTTFVTVKGSLHSIAMLDEAMRDRIAEFFRAKLVRPVIPGVQ